MFCKFAHKEDRRAAGRDTLVRPGRIWICVLVGLSVGCSDPRERFGRTWYIDGAGNWGFGIVDVPVGLREAGYGGVVSNHRWSLTLNPALDQTLRFIAQASGKLLASEITSYLRRYPDAEANVIALSAGTGVGIWAIENVKPPAKVNHFVLLGSSLSSRYDLNKALKNMKGNMYCYYTSSDPVLQGPVRALGTIDGTFDDAAGLVGLRGPGASGGRVKNIGRTSRHAALGWTGGHADCTNHRFVAQEIGPHIVTPASRANERRRMAYAPARKPASGSAGVQQ